VLVADYTFLDVMWSMFVFFLWVMWFVLLFTVWGDVFRRDDISGWGKTGWLIFTIVLPFLGVFVYLITQNEGMTERAAARARPRRARPDEHVPELPRVSAAEEIERGKALLDRGVITQAEFDVMKTNALA
jgi:hypothetical protein